MNKLDFFQLFPELENEFVWLIRPNRELFGLINHIYELTYLAMLSKKKRILEFGTFLGATAGTFILNGAELVFSLDKQSEDYDYKIVNCFNDSLIYVEGDSTSDIVKNFLNDFCANDGYFDLAFINGERDYDVVKNNFYLSLDVTNDDGTIVFYGYSDLWSGVMNFIDDLDRKALLHSINRTSLVIFRKSENESFWRSYLKK